MSLIAKSGVIPLACWWMTTEDVGEDMLQPAELLVAAKSLTDQRIERL